MPARSPLKGLRKKRARGSQRQETTAQKEIAQTSQIVRRVVRRIWGKRGSPLSFQMTRLKTLLERPKGLLRNLMT
jgi:hypothetical protein